ncbi:hypothetical protein HK098_007239 [Nowakowskiella sp. JEL0407]|nr:hypothetical protein HK098_007239 [Nowakowskiella sp. JEL0407]
MDSKKAFVNKTLTTVFIALLIDILAFTIILPLFPRLLQYYDTKDGNNKESFYFFFLSYVRKFKTLIGGSGSQLDVVLFGGAIGSLFSFLQFVSSPYIGSLSDKYGRRNILLLSMIGNGVSMLLWLFGKSFEIFVLSRVIGGLTEGNVQMSVAIISDITTTETRSRGLALVGIAFSLGFTLGPPLGAYFTNFDLLHYFPSLSWLPINNYSSPALFALVLIIIETIYLYFALPETNNFDNFAKKSINTTATDSKPEIRRSARLAGKSAEIAEDFTIRKKTPSQSDAIASQTRVRNLSLIHFLFLLFFSGMEFTLTFLTHDRFDFSHSRQGMLLGYMGLLSALVQGGYVRRMAGKKVSERTMVIQGILSCSIGLTICALSSTVPVLFAGATFLSFTSGTVVSCLTAMTSLAGDTRISKEDGGSMIPGKEHFDSSAKAKPGEGNNRGLALGQFRSFGQLGRSMGPIIACSTYWILGPTVAYTASAFLLTCVLLLFGILSNEKKADKAKSI